MAHKDLWISILKRLQPTIKKADFLTWFQNSSVLELKGSEMVVAVPNTFAKNQIIAKYHIKVVQAAKEDNPAVEIVRYEVSGKLNDQGNPDAVDVKNLFADLDKKVRKVRNVQEVVLSKGSSGHRISSLMLNPRYNLGSYVVGLDNRLPHAACQAVVAQPGGIYNPLYLYGKTGMGKTHLIQAIGNGVLKNFPDLVVQYLTAEQFVTEVVDAITQRHTKRFKDRYRNVDCFLVDDVQFFGRKDSSQQELFHTFNDLYNANKQIVLTSDRAPSELDGLDARLKDRFGMGMVVELIMPDFETRLAILHEKCKDFQVIIDPEVLSFIASNVQSSVRTLEGVLRQAVAEADLCESVPTIRSVAQIMKRMDKAQEIIGYDLEANSNRQIVKTDVEVMNVVARYYDVTLDELIGKDRHKGLMLPRQVSMYLIKKELGHSYEKIGEGFGGRNHTTVMHACNKTARCLRTDVRLVRDLNAIKREMGL